MSFRNHFGMITCVVLVIALALTGCGDAANAAHDGAPIAMPTRTVVGVIVDASKSSQRYELPLPRPEKIGELASAICYAGGGELEVFIVRESGKTIGPRVALPQGAPPPIPPSLGEIPSPAAAEEEQEYEKQWNEYQSNQKGRLEECRLRIDAFVKRLELEVPQERKAQTSAVNEALYFAMQFLNAPAEAQVNPAHRLLLVFSDCRNDSPASPPITLPDASTVRVLWVSADPGSIFPLPGAKPEPAPTTDQALDFALALVQPKGAGVPTRLDGGQR